MKNWQIVVLTILAVLAVLWLIGRALAKGVQIGSATGTGTSGYIEYLPGDNNLDGVVNYLDQR